MKGVLWVQQGVLWVQPGVPWVQQGVLWVQPGVLWVQQGVLWVHQGVLWVQQGVLWVQLGVLWVQQGVLWVQPGVPWVQQGVLWVQPGVLWVQQGVLWVHQGVLWVQQGVLWVQLGVLWVQQGVLWVQPGVLWVQQGVLWVQQGVLWVQPGIFWVQPGVLWVQAGGPLGAAGCPLGAAGCPLGAAAPLDCSPPSLLPEPQDPQDSMSHLQEPGHPLDYLFLSQPPLSAPCTLTLDPSSFHLSSSSSILPRDPAPSVFQFDEPFSSSSSSMCTNPAPPLPPKPCHQAQTCGPRAANEMLFFNHAEPIPRRISFSGLDQVSPGNADFSLRNKRLSLNLPFCPVPSCHVDPYLPMSSTLPRGSVDTSDGYLPMKPLGGPGAGPQGAHSSLLGGPRHNLLPPPIHRHLKPRRRAVGPWTRRSNLDYLSLDFNSASPSPVQKKALLVDEHKVDYVQVDETKTQALQSTRLEWTASRRPEGGEEKSLLRPRGQERTRRTLFSTDQ
ncbi:hypothetical protein CRUP_011485 [Coryphaenoides rupestris]|nr:hypothetical protein CRUP_011485 [Coryphaenoides rupestris]